MWTVTWKVTSVVVETDEESITVPQAKDVGDLDLSGGSREVGWCRRYFRGRTMWAC